MGTIYQLTFLFALTVLAILVTIFVFAVSLLGRALEAASREKEKTIKEQKESIEVEIADLSEQISRFEGKENISKELRELEKKLKNLRNKDRKYEKKLSKIGIAPRLLTVRGGVLLPAILLIGALILSGWAWGISDEGTLVSNALWLIGLIAIAFSIFRIYQSLRVIESVAVTSEAEAERRLASAVKTALKEVEDEKKPSLYLEFQGQKPPFQAKANTVVKIEFAVWLSQGYCADDASVVFYAPPGFKFPSLNIVYQRKNQPVVPGFITARVEYKETILSGGAIKKDISIAVPSKAGSYEMYYHLVCRGYNGEYMKFGVVVN